MEFHMVLISCPWWLVCWATHSCSFCTLGYLFVGSWLLKSLAHLKNAFFFSLYFLTVLSRFWVRVLRQMYVLWIFSQLLSCLFIVLMVPFKEQKFFHFDEVQIINVNSFVSQEFFVYYYIMKIFLFFSKSFIELALKFRSVNFGIYGIRVEVYFISLTYSVFHFFKRRFLSLIELIRCLNIDCLCMCLSLVSFLSHSSICLSLSQCHTVLITVTF